MIWESSGLLGAFGVSGDEQGGRNRKIHSNGTVAVLGLQQGSKLHRILHAQGDLQELPAWLQGSEAQQSPPETFLASPTALSSSQLQQCTPAGTTPAERPDDAGAGAASDATVAQLSLALAALQETILRGAAADQIDSLLEATVHGIGKDMGNSTPRKRLKFDEDTYKTVSAIDASTCKVTQLEHGRHLQKPGELQPTPAAAHALAVIAAAASATVDADSAADSPGWQLQPCM